MVTACTKHYTPLIEKGSVDEGPPNGPKRMHLYRSVVSWLNYLCNRSKLPQNAPPFAGELECIMLEHSADLSAAPEHTHSQKVRAFMVQYRALIVSLVKRAVYPDVTQPPQSEVVRRGDRRPPGEACPLRNFGATCYLNVLLQVMYNSTALDGLFGNEGLRNAREGAKETAVFRALWQTLAAMRENIGATYAPVAFANALRELATPADLDIGQNVCCDFCETAVFVLDAVHEATCQTAPFVSPALPDKAPLESKCAHVCARLDRSPVLSAIATVDVTTVLGATGQVLSQYVSHSTSMNVHLSTTGLMDCILASHAPEQLNAANGNQYFNCATGSHESSAARQTRYWILPPMLMVTLSRFSGQSGKTSQSIGVPLKNLDLRSLLTDGAPQTQPTLYDLYAVVDHFGATPVIGHYTVTVRCRDGEWRGFNDELISDIKIPENVDQVLSPTAYALFYVRK